MPKYTSQNSNSRYRDRPFLKLETSDIDEQADELTGWSQEYNQVAPGEFRGSLTNVWLDEGAQIYRETVNCALFERGAVWPGSISLVIPLRTNGTSTINGIAFSPNDILVCPGGVEWCVNTASEWDVLAISIPGNALCEAANDDVLFNIINNMKSPVLIGERGRHIQDLIRSAHLIFSDIEQKDQLFHESYLQEQITDAFTEVLSHCSLRTESRNICSRTTNQKLRIIASACEIANANSSVRIDEICKQLRVSRRTLQYYFEEMTGYSPCLFLRKIRLNQVRRDFLCQENQHSIHDLAAWRGFWHSGRFAQYYQELFGELPSKTGKIIRV